MSCEQVIVEMTPREASPTQVLVSVETVEDEAAGPVVIEWETASCWDWEPWIDSGKNWVVLNRRVEMVAYPDFH